MQILHDKVIKSGIEEVLNNSILFQKSCPLNFFLPPFFSHTESWMLIQHNFEQPTLAVQCIVFMNYSFGVLLFTFVALTSAAPTDWEGAFNDSIYGGEIRVCVDYSATTSKYYGQALFSDLGELLVCKRTVYISIKIY